MEPKVSIIIPCFNQGQYLKEAVDSVLASTYENIEIIVVNDGSTEYLDVLENFSAPKTKIIHQDNQGVSSARNNGIKIAAGKYILPLDADDKIHSEYIEKAVKVLEENSDVGIVYCRAAYFGSVNGEWKLKEHKFPNYLWENGIFCSAMYRKSDWERSGGYKPEMENGNEDWEFWITLSELGIKAYKIPEILFYYRQAENIRSNKLKNSGNELDRIKDLMRLHPDLYINNLKRIILPLNKVLSVHVPRDQIKDMYNFRFKLKLWKDAMLYILVGK